MVFNLTLLITGPDGFVGTQVCRELLRRGNCVIGALWKAAPLPTGCESVIVGNIGPDTDWTMALAGVNAVVHLAARVHIMDDMAVDPLAEYRRVNVEGTRCLAEAAVEAGVKRFLFLSSVKVNGERTVLRGRMSEGGPFTEMDEARPEDPYSLSKWEAEQILREIEQRTGMAVTILRSPLIYGPGVKANFLKLVQLVNRGVPLPFCCIRNQRSFLSITNLVDLICCCLEHPKAAGETFLVSDGEDVSTPELVLRIAEALGKKPRLLPIPEWMMKVSGAVIGKSAHVNRLCGSLQIDSSKVRRVLDWTPPCTMSEELARVAEWWRAVGK